MDLMAMNAKIKDIHEKSGKSRIWIFFDMVHCGRKFGAGYMDYWLYEMYNLNDAQRDTYITRGRSNDLVNRYNDPKYTHLIDNKIEFNEHFGEFLARKWIPIREDNKEEVISSLPRPISVHAERPLRWWTAKLKRLSISMTGFFTWSARIFLKKCSCSILL